MSLVLWFVGALLVVMLAAVATWTSASAGEVHQIQVGNTMPFVCDEQWHAVSWQNTTGRSIRILGFQLWYGLNYNAVADVGAVLLRASDWMMLANQAWDRYGNPNAPHHSLWMLPAGSYITVGSGDTLVTAGRCAAWSGGPASPSLADVRGHVLASVWYE